MQFNSVNIRIFSEFYAFCRIKHHSTRDDIPDVSYFFSHVSKEINYNEGETYCNEEDFWYNYPNNIAIIIDEGDGFMLQTFSNNKVGKLYVSIEENEAEIREFFEKNKGDVILLENRPSARSIKPDYESLLLYTQKIAEVDELRKEYNQVYRQCRQKGYDLELYRNDCTLDLDSEKYNYIIELAKEFIKELTEARGILADIQNAKLQELTIPVSDKEAYGVSFALFYRYYLNSKKHRSFHDQQLKIIFKEFVAKHPEAIDYFCEGTGRKFDKKKIIAELEADNIILKHYDSIADEILS